MRTDRLTMLITAAFLAILAIPALAFGAAPPDYTLEQSDGVGTLTVTGAEIVVVRGDGSAGSGDPEVVVGLALPDQLNGVGFGVGLDQVWRLPAGAWSVTASAPAATPGAVRESVTWDITIDAAPEPDRLQRIADALARWIAVANDWATLAPTPEEVRDALLVTFREPRQPVPPVPLAD
jgi:hypothetical protein